MGIYDREYYRRSVEESLPAWPRSAVANIVAICIIVYVLDWLFFSEDHRLTGFLALTDGVLLAPWLWWKFVTYGFVHSPEPAHIILNMLQLVFLGPAVEERQGTREFWLFYLVTVTLGGVAHALINWGRPYVLVGASGAVSAVVLLFVLYYPNRRLMIFPLPVAVPAWIIGLILVVINTLGAVAELGAEGGRSGIAFVVHLVGLAFAFVYYRYHWRLTGVLEAIASQKPRLKIRRPPPRPEEDSDETGDAMEEEIDRILEKISLYGEASLTRRERRILMDAARRYRDRLRERGSLDPPS